MKRIIGNFIALVFILLAAFFVSEVSEAEAATCGFKVQGVYVFCYLEKHKVYCAQDENWHASSYDVQYNGTTYEATRWHCGENLGDRDIPFSSWEGFDITPFEYGDSISVICIGFEYGFAMHPYSASWDINSEFTGVSKLICVNGLEDAYK